MGICNKYMKNTIIPLHLVLTLLLSSACVVIPSDIHGHQALVIEGVLSAQQDWLRTMDNFPSKGGPVEDVESFSIRYEHFSTPKSSFLLGISRKNYDWGTQSMEALLGSRWYSWTDKPLQPYVQLTAFVGDGWTRFAEIHPGPIDKDPQHYIGGSVGVGTVFFFGDSLSAEAGIKYESTLLPAEMGVGGQDASLDYSGVAGWVGLGFFF